MADRLDNTGLGYLWGKLKEIFGCFSVSTGTISSFPMIIQNSRIDESTVVENEWLFNDLDIGWMTVDGKLILYGDLLSGVTKPSVTLRLKKVAGESNAAKACVLSRIYNGDLKAEFTNLVPMTEYSYILVYNDGNDPLYVTSGDFVPTKPTHTLTFAYETYEFEAGSYQVTAVTFNSNTLSYTPPPASNGT